MAVVVREGPKLNPQARETGQKESQKYVPKERRERNHEEITCFYCGKKGHMKRACRQRMADERAFKDD